MTLEGVFLLLRWLSAIQVILAVIQAICLTYILVGKDKGPAEPAKPKAPTCCHCGRDLKPMTADEVFVSSLHHVAPAGATHYCDNHSPSRFFTERGKPQPPPELREL